MTRDAALSIRIEPELKTALEDAAKAARRSLAGYVEIVLTDHIAALKAASNPSKEK